MYVSCIAFGRSQSRNLLSKNRLFVAQKIGPLPPSDPYVLPMKNEGFRVGCTAGQPASSSRAKQAVSFCRFTLPCSRPPISTRPCSPVLPTPRQTFHRYSSLPNLPSPPLSHFTPSVPQGKPSGGTANAIVVSDC